MTFLCFDYFGKADGDDEDDEAPLYIAVVCFLTILFRASGEANLGTLKYDSECCLTTFVRASGEAILGTLKYVSER